MVNLRRACRISRIECVQNKKIRRKTERVSTRADRIQTVIVLWSSEKNEPRKMV